MPISMWIYIAFVVICVVLFMFRVAYVSETKELSVTYAKILLKKYKESRLKTPIPFHIYLEEAIRDLNYNVVRDVNLGYEYNINFTAKLKVRILKNWFKTSPKAEQKLIRNHFKMNLKQFIKSNKEWFPNNNDRNVRIYFLKRVISRNSK